MISEKTVELNLTAELLAWLYVITKRTHYVIAPSQLEEGELGFDAGFYGSGPAAFIQFKRAYVKGSDWRWHLNRTAKRDQHERLQKLQSNGVLVLYAFPYFHRPREVASWRRKLLTRTFWIPPLAIRPLGGPVGEHDLLLNSSTGKWQIASPDPIEINPPTALTQLTDWFQRDWPEGAMGQALHTVNTVVFEQDRGEPKRASLDNSRQLEIADLAVSFALIGRAVDDGAPEV